MVYKIPDLDLDLSNQAIEDMLDTIYHIPASKINEQGISAHGVGNYFCDIPEDRISGLASIDYKRAEEEFGYIKIDFLHNVVYDRFQNRSELIDCIDKPIDWSLLYKKDIVEKLPHINNYFTLLNQMPKIDSIEKLAMFISIVRPGKKYLIDEVLKNKNWDCILNRIWIKEDTGYMYKKSHAIAFALMISVALKSL